jgi:site-specific DNA recombinase
MAILARDLDPFVADAALHRLDTPELEASLRGEAAKDAEAAAIHHDLDDALDQADELARAYADKQITMREWLAARGPVDERVEELRKALSRATRTTTISQYVGQSATLRREWDILDLSRQQAIVGAVLDHVVVNPARPGFNRFDESRLVAVWKP